ncbi:MAG: hypothetical protein J2P49_01155, partial [Methylocapsa sp.]|nr:hypothetical protein [Methylocapsa sp.]
KQNFGATGIPRRQRSFRPAAPEKNSGREFTAGLREMKKNFLLSAVLVFFPSIVIAGQAAVPAVPPGAVLTYHNDHFRTGWQQHEKILTSANFPATFGILQRVTLKDQVDAQPLVVPGLTINGGKDIVIIADESNNVYEIDAATGTIVKQKNLGPPVPRPLDCGNNGPNVGINSTPVIDWPSRTIFLIAYIDGSPPSYRLHALDLNTLSDKVAPVTVAASHKLSDGSLYTFNASVQRQRPGLLLSNGVIYAGFGSFCDFSPGKSRGWLLEWKWNSSTPSLTPIGGVPEPGQLDDKDVNCPSSFPCSSTNFFLSSIWMSGYGIAADTAGNVFFSTGNSDNSGAKSSTWDGVNNIQESVVELSPYLTRIIGVFSPNSAFGSFSPNTLQLDRNDTDLGSGGVLLVPPLSGHYLAAAAGKDGRLFLFDRQNHGMNTLKLLQTILGPACWCGPSYFVGPDGLGRVVTSKGKFARTWRINAGSSSPSLSLEPGAALITSGQDPGFFTAISCTTSGIAYGRCAPGSAIIWAVSRPNPTSANGFSTAVNLHAFSAVPSGGSYRLLFGPAQAGFWPNIGGNANIVPVVSNGRVYVASNKLLTIFGVRGPAPSARFPAQQPIATLGSAFSISGILVDIQGATLTFKNRNGKNRQIDASEAMKNERVAAALIKGKPFTAVGSSFTATGSPLAEAIYRARGNTGDEWPPDKDPNLAP